MPLKYYCPKCEKRYIDWGAEKLEFKCPECNGEALIRVGTAPENSGDAPTLSKSAAKRKAKPRAKAPRSEPVAADIPPASSGDDDTEDLDSDVSIDDEEGSEVLGDSLAIDDD